MMSTEESTPNLGRREGGTALPTMSRKGLIWSAIGVIALIAIAAWFGFGKASDAVRWQATGFNADLPTEATATYDVFLYSDQSAKCSVRALNDRFAEVGVATQFVDRADGAEQRLTTTIITTEQATTATVNYCVPVDQ